MHVFCSFQWLLLFCYDDEINVAAWEKRWTINLQLVLCIEFFSCDATLFPAYSISFFFCCRLKIEHSSASLAIVSPHSVACVCWLLCTDSAILLNFFLHPFCVQYTHTHRRWSNEPQTEPIKWNRFANHGCGRTAFVKAVQELDIWQCWANHKETIHALTRCILSQNFELSGQKLTSYDQARTYIHDRKM